MTDSTIIETGLVSTANQLLETYHIPKKIHHWWQIDSAILITVYEAIFCKRLNDVSRSGSRADETGNIDKIVACLEEDLNYGLHHITGEGIVKGEKVQLQDLLDIFKYMMEYVLEDIRSVSSGSETGDYERSSPAYDDPDLVTPEIIDEILDKELSQIPAEGVLSTGALSNGVNGERLSTGPLSDSSDHRESLAAASGPQWESPSYKHERRNRIAGHTGPAGIYWEDSSNNQSGSTNDLIMLGNQSSNGMVNGSSRENTEDLIALGNSPPTKDYNTNIRQLISNDSGLGTRAYGTSKDRNTSRDADSTMTPVPSIPDAPQGSEVLSQFDRIGLRPGGVQPSRDPLASSLPLPAAQTRRSDNVYRHHHYHHYDKASPATSASASLPVTASILTSPFRGHSKVRGQPRGQPQSRPSVRVSQDNELDAILSQNPVMAAREADRITPPKYTLSTLSPGGRVTKSRSFDNLRSLINETTEMSHQAVASSPLRDAGPARTTQRRTQKSKSATSFPRQQNTSLDPRVSSVKPPVRVADQLAPPRQSNCGPGTYEEYLNKYYGGPLRPRSDTEDDDMSQHSDGVIDYGDREDYIEELSSDDELERLRKKVSKKSVRFRLQDDSAPGRMKGLQKKLSKEQLRELSRSKYVDRLYQWQVADYIEGMDNAMEEDRQRARQVESDYKKKTFKKPKTNSKTSKSSNRSRSRGLCAVVKPRRRSASCSPTVGKRIPLTIGDDNLLPILLEHFPHLKLSKETLHNLWRKGMRQVEQATRTGQETQCTHKINSQMEETEKRHKVLTDIMKKDIAHVNRMREIKERQRQQQSVKSRVRDRRLQSARVRQYYDEYQVRMRAKMLKKRTRQEMIFKNLFEEGLDIQRDRAREMRRYAREQRDNRAKIQQDQIDSIENYYRDQYAMLAEAVTKEKQDLNVREGAQTKLMKQMQKEMRKKMEKEIEALQEQIYRDTDDEYFRQLDADRLKHALHMARYKTKV